MICQFVNNDSQKCQIEIYLYLEQKICILVLYNYIYRLKILRHETFFLQQPFWKLVKKTLCWIWIERPECKIYIDIILFLIFFVSSEPGSHFIVQVLPYFNKTREYPGSPLIVQVQPYFNKTRKYPHRVGSHFIVQVQPYFNKTREYPHRVGNIILV